MCGTRAGRSGLYLPNLLDEVNREREHIEFLIRKNGCVGDSQQTVSVVLSSQDAQVPELR